MITRPDKFLTISFSRSNDQWTTFAVEWREVMDDGTTTWDRQRSETYLIEDLPSQVKADLQSAWDGMKTHRDFLDPL